MNLQRIYEYRFASVDRAARTAVWLEIARFLHERLGRPGRVLDPAAGLGEFIRACPAPERWAVDIVDLGISELPGVTTRISPILEADLPSEHFDLVFASNVLEHFESPDEISQFLGRMHGLLRDSGRVCVMGPNFRYCSREYFDCADHTLALTHVAAAEHLYGAGFVVEEVVPRFLPYSFRSVLPASPRLTAAYLRSPLAWRVLGKQFLVTGRKPPG
jgi:2-polyprenyl-3-methyl-5-hydroxy-6-metoxy-1,4-benzoquinol methylase